MYKETENIPTPYHLHQFLWTSPRFTVGQDTDHSAYRPVALTEKVIWPFQEIGEFPVCTTHLESELPNHEFVLHHHLKAGCVFPHTVFSFAFCSMYTAWQLYTVWQLIMTSGWVFYWKLTLFACVCVCVHARTCAPVHACVCVCVCLRHFQSLWISEYCVWLMLESAYWAVTVPYSMTLSLTWLKKI